MATTTMQKQEILMKRLGELLSHDLGYIWGERESGPNGEKKEFLDKGQRFLTQLGKDLGFTDMRVSKNSAGIAVSGDVTLMGIWSEGNGLNLQLTQPCIADWCLYYRESRHLKDYGYGNSRQFMTPRVLQAGDYAALLRTLQTLNRSGAEVSYGTAA